MWTRISGRSRAQIEQLDAQLDKLSEGGALTLVAWEKPSIAYADVLTRGVYTARTERVEANTPHYLPPLPAGVPHNRLALAKWTVSPDNPLTARVTVNRMWYELFGTGMVETTEDFGIMGQRPSHPELLDWLAVEFRESGWNIKHMYKLMVMSATYRQSAKSTPEQLAKDPKNLLLSHGPRFRMDAEMLRDIALQSGGLLVNEDWRPKREAVSAGKCVGAGELSGPAIRCLCPGARRCALPAQHVHLLEADGDDAGHGCVRCADARCGLHPATADGYASAGAGDDERCAMG